MGLKKLTTTGEHLDWEQTRLQKSLPDHPEIDKKVVLSVSQLTDALKPLAKTCKQMISEAREGLKKPPVITKELVAKGLQFICDNKDMEQTELVRNLIGFGCVFSIEDINNQYPDWNNKSAEELREREPNSNNWPIEYYIQEWARCILWTMESPVYRDYSQSQAMFTRPHTIKMLTKEQ